MYSLSRREPQSPEEFAARLTRELAPRLLDRGALQVAVAVHDADVSPAASLRIVNQDPPIEAVVSLWVHTANDRCDWEPLLDEYASSICGYLVAESQPLREASTLTGGQRRPGMLQVAFLQIPAGMDAGEWFRVWRDDHTAVAIETQSTCAYRQNQVVRALTSGAPPFAAIVEEAFPAGAMTSQHAFYDATGDDDKLARNRGRMWKSSQRFVDLSSIEVVPTSEYVW